jgi:hypothetical protein
MSAGCSSSSKVHTSSQGRTPGACPSGAVDTETYREKDS